MYINAMVTEKMYFDRKIQYLNV